MNLLKYLIMPLSPRSSLQQLAEDKQQTIVALIELGIIGFLYTLTVYIGYLNGFGAVVKPILARPPEKYYLWDSRYMLPVWSCHC